MDLDKKESKEYATCQFCKKQKKKIHISLSGKSEGMCKECYRKLLWKRKLISCARCERMLPMHAKGLCSGCYNSIFHIDKVKEHNAKRRHNIQPELYKELMKGCKICGFDKIIDIHHLDHNHTNNFTDNLLGLCPNHHKMIHSKKYQQELFSILKEKGFKIPEKGYKTDGFIRVPRNIRFK